MSALVAITRTCPWPGSIRGSAGHSDLDFVTRENFASRPAASSKHHLNNSQDEFFRRPDCQQERQEWSGGDRGQTRDILEAEGHRAHFADQRKAVAKIGERLNVCSSKEFLRRDGIASTDPPLVEPLDVLLSELAVFGQSLPSYTSHPGSKHQ